MKMYNEELKKLLSSMNNTGREYDCIVPISGGKDGSFILWYLKMNTNLRLLAYHIDNWYVSTVASENVKNVCKKLNVDLVIYRSSWEKCKLIYNALLSKMGEICIACEYMINLFPLEYAVKNHIPYIAWGLTPNQLVSKHIFDGGQIIGYKFYDNMVKYYGEIFKTVLGDESYQIKEWNMPKKDYQKEVFPQFIFPFFYLDYDAEAVETIVTEHLDWKRGQDIGGTSSNCTINKLHIYLKRAIKGKEFYESMLENKRKVGEATDITVSHAMENCEFEDVRPFLDELGIFENERQLVQQIKTYKKSILLRKESNISQ